MFTSQIQPLTPDEAAVQAIRLFSQDARLCERHPNKMPRTHEEKLISESDAKGEAETYTKKLNDVVPTNDISLPLNEESSKSSRKMNHKTGKWPDSLPL